MWRAAAHLSAQRYRRAAPHLVKAAAAFAHPFSPARRLSISPGADGSPGEKTRSASAESSSICGERSGLWKRLLNRRDFLRVVGASALAAALAQARLRRRATACGSMPALRELSSAAPPFSATSRSDEAYARLVAEQCQLVLPANELKWDMLQPKPGEYDFAPADWMLRFAESHGLLFRGHVLLWEPSTPRVGPQQSRRGKTHGSCSSTTSAPSSRTTRGRMHSWDVVNEILEPADGRSDMFRNSLWLDLLGAEWIELAFHLAREADPNALLVYNENWLESDRESSRAKRQRVLALLAEWKRRGVPVQALGLQAHLLTDDQAGAGAGAVHRARRRPGIEGAGH